MPCLPEGGVGLKVSALLEMCESKGNVHGRSDRLLVETCPPQKGEISLIQQHTNSLLSPPQININFSDLKKKKSTEMLGITQS